MRAWKSVRALHEAALRFSPPNNEAVKFLADLEIADGNSEKALALANILRSNKHGWMKPRDLERNRLKADYITAVAAFQSGKSDLALTLLKKIRAPYSILAKREADKRARADYKTVLLLSGVCFDKNGKPDEATECYASLASLFRPSERNGLYYSGVALMRRARYAEAAAAFKKILDTDSGDQEAAIRFEFCVRKGAIETR
ncbi:MAG: tetratricopeptide repeat protein [Kiritimatiellaeota bacterium]|nr:tetratricopeptide repeat protein [Kiritimatiellota bacterium]